MNDRDWVNIEIVSTCEQQMERCADHVEAAQLDVSRLIDAIRCGYLAVLSAMIGSLVGSAGVGAYGDKLRAKHLAYLMSAGRDGLEYPEEFTMPFGEALRAIQSPGGIEIHGPIVLSEAEVELAAGLDFYRQLIDHPKPTSWSVPSYDLWEIVCFVPKLVTRISAGHHRFYEVHGRIERASNRICADRIDRSFGGKEVG